MPGLRIGSRESNLYVRRFQDRGTGRHAGSHPHDANRRVGGRARGGRPPRARHMAGPLPGRAPRPAAPARVDPARRGLLRPKGGGFAFRAACCHVARRTFSVERSDYRMGSNLQRFLGGSPLAVLVKLAFLSLLVGAFMSFLGVTPGGLIRQVWWTLHTDSG